MVFGVLIVFLLADGEERRVDGGLGQVNLGVGRGGELQARALLACLLGSAEAVFLLGRALSLQAFADIPLLGSAEGLPLADDHEDDVWLAHGGVLVAVLVIALP